MKKTLIFIVLAIIAGGTAFLFARHNAEKVEAVHPVRGPAVQAVYASGTVEPSVMIPISARQTARLMMLVADEGQKVKKGDTLAQMEDTDLAQSLAEQKAKASLAQKEYARKAELYKRKATSAQDLDQAQAERETAHAIVERLQAQLSYLKLSAPEDGFIIRRDGETGEMIPANQPVFWMSCCKPLRIAAEVDEEDISLVTPGEKVFISADAFPGQTFNGIVQSITPKGDPVARSYRVRIGLDGETPLMIGMTAETNIITRETKNALLIPKSAYRNGKIWVLENGRLKSINAETGIKSDKAIEITNGIDENSIVILNATDILEEGAAVPVSIEQWQAR